MVILPTVKLLAVPVAFVKTTADGVPRAGVTKVILVIVPVAFVKTTADGVPRSGVVRVGEVANTNAPEPVSSEIIEASWVDVVEPN